MSGGARFPPGVRRPGRAPLDHRVIAERRSGDEIELHVLRVSAHGFTASGEVALGKGDRVTIPLPTVGRIEAFMTWRSHGRAGFQFERVLRPPEFSQLMEALDHALPPAARPGRIPAAERGSDD